MKEYKGSPALGDAGLLASAQAVEPLRNSRYGTLKSALIHATRNGFCCCKLSALHGRSVTGFAETFAERTYPYFLQAGRSPRDRTACLRMQSEANGLAAGSPCNLRFAGRFSADLLRRPVAVIVGN